MYRYEQYVHICVCLKLIYARCYENRENECERSECECERRGTHTRGHSHGSSETRLHGDTCERHLYSAIKDIHPHPLHPITESQMFIY